MIIPIDRLLAESNLGREQALQVDRFIEMMLETNAHTNLTRITDPEAILTDHILDSLSILDTVRMNEGSSLCDVGCGAGFPGLILKIARPDLSVTSWTPPERSSPVSTRLSMIWALRAPELCGRERRKRVGRNCGRASTS